MMEKTLSSLPETPWAFESLSRISRVIYSPAAAAILVRASRMFSREVA